MAEAGELRKLFEVLLDLPVSERGPELSRMNLSEERHARLQQMLELEREWEDRPNESEVTRTHPWPGDEVGSYRLIAPLGDGGMGAVWLAVSKTSSDVMVAVKFAHGVRVERQEARQRLLQERSVLALLDHPNVVSIVDAGEVAAGGPFLVLQACRGVPMDTWMQERRPTRERRLSVLHRLVSALEHVHSRGILHRDLKPGNVMVSAEDWPMLLDFGVARITDRAAIAASFVTQGVAPHTPAFASPEQQEGEETTPATDVYALGQLSRQHLLAEEWEGGDPVLRRILERACSEQPRDRYPSVSALWGDVEAWARPSLSGGRPGHRWVLGTILLAVLVGLFAFAAAWFWPRSESLPIEDFMEATSGLSSEQLGGEPEVWLEAAKRYDEPDWSVVAAVGYLDREDPEAALAQALVASERYADLAPRRALELAAMLRLLGRPGLALEVFDSIDEDELGAELAFQAWAVELRACLAEFDGDEEALTVRMARAMEAAEVDEPEDFLADLAEEGEEPSEREVFLLLLAAGSGDALEVWLEFAEDEIWDDPLELDTLELEALLMLHASWRRAGLVEPLSGDLLAEIEEEARARNQEEENGDALQLWCLARELRIREAQEFDVAQARQLCSAGVDFLLSTAWEPSSLLYRLSVLEVQALARAGLGDVANHVLAEALSYGQEAFGRNSYQLACLANRDFENLALPEGGDCLPLATLDAPEDLLELVREESESRRSPPWWCR